MKTRIYLITALIAIIAVSSYAQGRDHKRDRDRKKEYRKEWRGEYGRKESTFERSLTYKQKVAINQIQLRSDKDSKQLKSKLRKLEARHQTLIHKNKPNLRKINANINEIEQVKSHLARIEAKSRIDILSLLNRQQKRLFTEHEKRYRRSGKYSFHRI